MRIKQHIDTDVKVMTGVTLVVFGVLMGLFAPELLANAQSSPQAENIRLVESDEFDQSDFGAGWIFVDKDADVFAYIVDPNQPFISTLAAPGTVSVLVALTKYSAHGEDLLSALFGVRDDFLDSLEVIVVRDVEWNGSNVYSGNLLDRVAAEVEAVYPYIGAN